MTMSGIKALIVGKGSIGKRHGDVLAGLGLNVYFISRHDASGSNTFASLPGAFEYDKFDYVVVANRTSEHIASLLELERLGFKGKCLVEKPLFTTASDTGKFNYDLTVGYVLRFNPMLQRLREIISGQKILSINAYCGQYLPEWRPNQDYRQCYSSSRVLGGGALRDLSHELDYLQYIAGGWKRVVALGGKYSGLEIDSDDQYMILMESDSGAMSSCHINYLDRNIRRFCAVEYEGGSVIVDFIGATFTHNKIVEKFSFDRNDLFIAMHKAILNSDSSIICSYADGVRTVHLIDAIEESAKKGAWICC